MTGYPHQIYHHVANELPSLLEMLVNLIFNHFEVWNHSMKTFNQRCFIAEKYIEFMVPYHNGSLFQILENLSFPMCRLRRRFLPETFYSFNSSIPTPT
jgi:hypothetical protein